MVDARSYIRRRRGRQPALSSPDAHDPRTRVLVAEEAGTVLGDVFAGVESTNWMELRTLRNRARRLRRRIRPPPGAGRELTRAAIAWIRSKSRSQVVLLTKTRNERAQQLFTSLGFRPTMIEMTLELDGNAKGDG